MSVANTLRGIITADASGVEEAVSTAEQRLDGLAGVAQSNAEKMQTAGKRMTMGISAPLAAMGGLAVRQAANFDDAMQSSIAVMGDVDEAMREDLEATAREVARTTTRSHEEAANSFYFLASAGLDAAEAMEALPQVAAFAEAGNMDMARATDVATNVMSAFGYEAEQMGEVTDVLTATVSSHNQTMEGMSSAMSKVAPTAASLGVSIEETAAAIGMLGDVGIQADRAGTGLNAIMAQLSDSSSTAAKQLQEAGVQVKDAEGNMLPLADIIAQIEESSLEASDAAQLFGREAGPAAAALIRQGSEAMRENSENIDEMENATEEMAETQRQTLNKELQQARSNLNDVAITIGADLVPMLSTLTGYVSTASEHFQDLSEDQRTAVLVVGTLAVVIPPVIWLLGTLFSSAAAVSAGFATMAGAGSTLAGVLTGGVIPAALATNVVLGPITVPIWAIIAAVGALIAIGYGLYRAWTDNIYGVRDTTQDAFGTVRGWLQSAPDWVLALIGPIGWLYKAWRDNLFGVQDFVGSVFDWIGGKIDWLIEKIESIPGLEFSDSDVDVAAVDEELAETPMTAGQQGENAGEEWSERFESEAQAEPQVGDPAGGTTGGDVESVDGVITQALVEDLGEDWIEQNTQAAEGEAGLRLPDIDEDVIEKMAAETTITPEKLGITSTQFNALLGESSTGSSGGGGSAQRRPDTDLLQSTSPGSSGSGLSAGDIRSAVADALADWSEDAVLELLMNINQRELEDLIDDRIDARFSEVAGP